MPGRAPAGTTSSSPAARSPARARLPGSPARAALFGWGEPKGKSFAGGAGWGAPWAAGTRRGRPVPLLLGGAGRTARPRASAFLSLPRALPGAPGELRRGARGPGRAAASPGPEARRRGGAPRGWEAAGARARRGHRGPCRDTRATPPGARSAPATAVADAERVCARRCGSRSPLRARRVLSRRRPGRQPAAGHPAWRVFRGRGRILPWKCALAAAVAVPAPAYVVTPGSRALCGVNAAAGARRDRRLAEPARVASRVDRRILFHKYALGI